MDDYFHGWYQLAFERDICDPVTPLAFGARSLIAVRSASGVRVFDAVCPHRGAHLGYGGRLADGALVCPFHGHLIGLGSPSAEGYCVREYASLAGGGGLFVRLSDQAGPDFPRALDELGSGHTLVPGFEMSAETTIETVIENGFDSAHFPSVHGLLGAPAFAVRRGTFGELEAEGVFEIPSGGRYSLRADGRNGVRARYLAHAFSPGLLVSELNGAPPLRYRIMTTATPSASPSGCVIRLTLMLPTGEDRSADERFAGELIEYSREGLEKDRAIWSRLSPRHVPRLAPEDATVVAFAEFCRRFGPPSPS